MHHRNIRDEGEKERYQHENVKTSINNKVNSI